MRAARYHGVRDIRIEELPDPTPQSGEVLVKVAHNGICGSDLHEYYSAPTFIPVDPHPLTGVSVPVVLGHEFSGTVVEVGDGVDPGLVGTNGPCGRPTAAAPVRRVSAGCATSAAASPSTACPPPAVAWPS